jgi:hypothetical protein
MGRRLKPIFMFPALHGPSFVVKGYHIATQTAQGLHPIRAGGFAELLKKLAEGVTVFEKLPHPWT